jgi:hypothetical protein
VGSSSRACELHLCLEVRLASRDTSVPHTSAENKRLRLLIESQEKFFFRVNIIHLVKAMCQ